ncbi:MAG: RloB domain-containing protein [Saprospiraceae bacterium]|nr:RloB domain-containing protein [Saprospiraceae bacterium]
MALSNPCFEVWLYGHIGNPKDLEIKTAKAFKTQIHKDYNGGYDAVIFTKLIANAIKIAKNNDSNVNSDFPKLQETKVYRLAESITNSILK